MKLYTIGFLVMLFTQTVLSKTIEPENVLIYSTSAKSLIKRVYSEDQKYLWFENCTLFVDNKGLFEGFSAKNCHKISDYKVLNTRFYTKALNSSFQKNLEKEIENGDFFYQKGFLVATVISATLSRGRAFDLKKAVKNKTSGNLLTKIIQTSVLIVATGYLAAKTVIMGIEAPPSIETNLLKYIGENSSVENNLNIHINSSTPREIMHIIRSSLVTTLEDIGVITNI